MRRPLCPVFVLLVLSGALGAGGEYPPDEVAVVLVRGPEGRLRAKEAATTAPVDVSGLVEPTVFEADIILPRPELRLVSAPTRARVTVLVEPVKGAPKVPAAKKRPS